jgi:hypothetical protein
MQAHLKLAVDNAAHLQSKVDVKVYRWDIATMNEIDPGFL